MHKKAFCVLIFQLLNLTIDVARRQKQMKEAHDEHIVNEEEDNDHITVDLREDSARPSRTVQFFDVGIETVENKFFEFF